MELRHLRYFVAVGEELSFTRAALKLHTSQPSISTQIRQIEEEIGTRLLERTRHYVRLTLAGRIFLAEAREILARVDRAVSTAAHAAGKSELCVFSFPAADVKVLPRLYPLVTGRLRDLHLVTLSRYMVDPIAGLRQGTLDVAFLRGPVVEADMVITELVREPFMVLVPADHRLAREEKIRPGSIEGLRCIRLPRSSGLYDALNAFCVAANVPLHPDYESDIVGHLQMVSLGLGFSLLPDFVRPQLPEGVVMRPLDWTPVPTVPIEMVRLREHQSDDLRAFLQIVHECFGATDGAARAVKTRSAAGSSKVLPGRPLCLATTDGMVAPRHRLPRRVKL